MTIYRKKQYKILLRLCVLFAVFAFTISSIIQYSINKTITIKICFISAIIGLIIVFALGLYSLLLSEYFKKVNLLLGILLNSIFYLLIIALVPNIVLISFEVLHFSFDFFQSKIFLFSTLGGLSLSILINILIAIGSLVGLDYLILFVFGKYHTPQKEKRVFMFLDIKSSTSITEKIGDLKFLTLLNEFFYDVSEIVHMTNGEIYRYVGDEAIISWKGDRGFRKSNCIMMYFQLKDLITNKRRVYLEKFGIIPDFRAGIHFGSVVIGEIGSSKKEITFIGDILNSTSRIVDICREKQMDLLVSDEIIKKLKLEKSQIINCGSFKLRGKENELRLYSINTTTDLVKG